MEVVLYSIVILFLGLVAIGGINIFRTFIRFIYEENHQ